MEASGYAVKILIIDDDKSVRKMLTAFLPSKGYLCLEAENGNDGLVMAAQHHPDLILLDLGLPDIDGVEVIKRLREWYAKPVLILSARWEERQKVEALDLGADDYITKPFGIEELLARIRTAIRHEQSLTAQQSSVFTTRSLTVDLAQRKVSVNGETVHLTPIEYRLLNVLIKHAGKVVTHNQLLHEVWGLRSNDFAQYLRVYMTHLRRKLESDPAHPKIFETEVGVGYRIIVE